MKNVLVVFYSLPKQGNNQKQPTIMMEHIQGTQRQTGKISNTQRWSNLKKEIIIIITIITEKLK